MTPETQFSTKFHRNFELDYRKLTILIIHKAGIAMVEWSSQRGPQIQHRAPLFDAEDAETCKTEPFSAKETIVGIITAPLALQENF